MEQICDNCKYWTSESDARYMGRCNNGTEKKDENGVLTGIHMPWRFGQSFVPYAFSCKFWKEREKNESN